MNPLVRLQCFSPLSISYYLLGSGWEESVCEEEKFKRKIIAESKLILNKPMQQKAKQAACAPASLAPLKVLTSLFQQANGTYLDSR